MITASGIARLLACPGSAVLPRAENRNEWADRGREEHDELEGALNSGDLPDYIAKVTPPGARSEVKLAFDVETRRGRIIGEGAGRDYGKPGPFEIVGSADVLGVDGDAAVVLDYKTGFGSVERAETNSQLRFYGLAAAAALGLSRAIVRIVFTKSEYVDEAEIGPLELAEFAGQLQRLHTRIATARAVAFDPTSIDTREGPWCKHCPSKAACPSKNALLVQVAEGGLAVIGDSVMTPARAARAYHVLTSLSQLVDDGFKRLDVYTDENGSIDLGGGRRYGRYQRKGNEKVDVPIAIKAIRDVLSPDLAKEFETVAIVPTTSKAAIDRAAKEVLNLTTYKKSTALAKAVLAKVRELGGISSSPTYPVGEYASGKDEPAEKPAIDTDEVDRMLEQA